MMRVVSYRTRTIPRLCIQTLALLALLALLLRFAQTKTRAVRVFAVPCRVILRRSGFGISRVVAAARGMSSLTHPTQQ